MKRFCLSLCFWTFAIVCAALLFPHGPAAAADKGALSWPMVGFGGMIVNAASLAGLFTNIKTSFNKAFAAAPSFWQKVAMRVPSTGKINDYKWLENFPRMRRWIGDKSVKSLAGQGYVVENLDWEATIEVDRNDIEDDQLGIYATQAEMAGFSAAQLPDEIVADLVNNSMSQPCYDGQYFIDTDHPVTDANGAVQSVSNKGTAKLKADTQANAIASLGAGLTAMRKFTDNEGRPLNITPNILLVPPALLDVANILANNAILDDGKPNPYKGVITPVCDARLSSDVKWYLLDTTKPVKPFIYQERKAPVFVSQTDASSDDVFTRKKFKYGAEARAAGGYGFWQLAYGSDGTV